MKLLVTRILEFKFVFNFLVNINLMSNYLLHGIHASFHIKNKSTLLYHMLYLGICMTLVHVTYIGQRVRMALLMLPSWMCFKPIFFSEDWGRSFARNMVLLMNSII